MNKPTIASSKQRNIMREEESTVDNLKAEPTGKKRKVAPSTRSNNEERDRLVLRPMEHIESRPPPVNVLHDYPLDSLLLDYRNPIRYDPRDWTYTDEEALADYKEELAKRAADEAKKEAAIEAMASEADATCMMEGASDAETANEKTEPIGWGWGGTNIAVPQPEGWKCNVCGLSNHHMETKCAACEAPVATNS